MMLGITKGIF